MKLFLNTLVCLSLIFAMSLTMFAETPLTSSNNVCLEDHEHFSYDSTLTEPLSVELQDAIDELYPGESISLSNGMFFTKSPIQARATYKCPKCKRSGATYTGILRDCYSQTGSYCNVKNYKMYDCNKCGLVSGSATKKTKDHKTYSANCFVGK